jgi:hypothetical protein
MSKVTDADFLNAYCGEDDWAEQRGITKRTLRRYRRAGLPHLSVVRDFETGGNPNLREILAHPV